MNVGCSWIVLWVSGFCAEDICSMCCMRLRVWVVWCVSIPELRCWQETDKKCTVKTRQSLLGFVLDGTGMGWVIVDWYTLRCLWFKQFFHWTQGSVALFPHCLFHFHTVYVLLSFTRFMFSMKKNPSYNCAAGVHKQLFPVMHLLFSLGIEYYKLICNSD